MAPLWIIGVGAFFLYSAFAQAGRIRELQTSEDHPGTVVLALGRSTAISFGTRPEKVVPGSPQAIQINFLGSDLTVTPVSKNPGNLLVYTKSGRYVILFRIGGAENYDDVVKIVVGGRGTPIHLLTDSLQAIALHIDAKRKGQVKLIIPPDPITVLETGNGLEITGPDLTDLFSQSGPYRCKGCITRPGNTTRLSCVAPIAEIHCESKAVVLTLKRVSP